MAKDHSVIVGWMAGLRHNNRNKWYIYLFSNCSTAPSGLRPPIRAFLITLRHTTLWKSPSAGRRDLSLPTHDPHKRPDFYSPLVIRSPQSQQANGRRPTL